MNSSRWCLVGLTMFWIGGAAATASAQEPAAVLPEHAILKKDVGQWDAEMKVWLQPGEPMAFQCLEVNRMLGDQWLISDFSGDFLGTTFEGRGQFGYDADAKQYVGTWIDNMSSHMTSMSGKYDDQKKTMTMEGESTDPTGKKVKTRNITYYKSNDHRVMTMEKLADESGEWFKSMEISYTRKK